MWKSVLALAALSLVTLSACAPDAAYRTNLDVERCGTKCTGQHALEEHTYQVRDGQDGRYLMGYVEFDDQGWPHPTGQRQALMEQLSRRARAGDGEQFLVVAYVHGWFHNAREDDTNVAAFRALLERLDLMERAAVEAKIKARKRTVIGVYLGWRGETLEVPLLKQAFTFWSRMGAAERVGEGGLKQVLMELNQFKCFANRGLDKTGNHPCDDTLRGDNATQMVTIGHSFGGLATFRAMRTELMERTTRLWRTRTGEYPYSIMRGFGDLVLLVNPAFEGSAYEPLWQASQSRCYSTSQRPAMMIITSTTDRATGWAFPLGRLYTLTQSADQEGEREAVMMTVGHLDRYKTHDISWQGSKDGTGTITPSKDLNYGNFVTEAKAIKVAQDSNSLGVLDTPQADYDPVRLDRVTEAERTAQQLPAIVDRTPFLVAAARPEIIDGHSDIWNDRFVEFMRRFFIREIRPPDAIVDPPCSLF